jgi:hypothetical protein
MRKPLVAARAAWSLHCIIDAFTIGGVGFSARVSRRAGELAIVDAAFETCFAPGAHLRAVSDAEVNQSSQTCCV